MATEPQDYYDDSPAAPAEPAGPTDAEQSKTSILPKTFFSDGVKPGDTISVEVTAVHDSDVEVKVSGDTTEPDADDQPEPVPEESSGGDDSMQSMMG